MKKVIFIKNAIILTLTSLLIRLLGVFFKVWLAANIGSESIGLYSLVFSVYIFFATFATSGISTAVTRLVAEKCENLSEILKKAIYLSLFIAFLSQTILYFGSDIISLYFIKDPRASFSIKILSFSLPFMGICSCFKGYFLARRKATPPSISQITEQTIRILIVFFLINKFSNLGIEYTCAAVFVGDTLSEISSCLFLYLIYKKDIKKIVTEKISNFNITKEILRISTPISSGRYLNSGLRTIENMLVPQSLVKNGLNMSAAVSHFGMIKGMALPVLFFPSSLLSSVSTLLIPEISEATAKGYKGVIKSSVIRSLKITSLVGFIFGVLFFFCGENLGIVIYKDPFVGKLLKYLSPIVPLMYLDSIADGLLKGLDCQMITFKNSVLDSLLRIILIFVFVPIYGFSAFLVIMYLSNFLTCFLNLFKLFKLCNIKINIINSVILPVLFAVFSGLISNMLTINLKIPIIINILILCLFSSVLYIFLLEICGISDIFSNYIIYFGKKKAV